MSGIKYDIHRLWIVCDRVIAAPGVIDARHDGTQISATSFHVRGASITDHHMCRNLNPVYANGLGVGLQPTQGGCDFDRLCRPPVSELAGSLRPDPDSAPIGPT